MKRFNYILITILLTNYNAYAIVVGTAVSDFETHNKLTKTNKYLIEQREKLDSNSDLLTEIKSAMMGNNNNTYSVIMSTNINADISNIKIPNLLKGNRVSIINKNLDRLYPMQDFEVSENEMPRSKQMQQRQSELKQILAS